MLLVYRYVDHGVTLYRVLALPCLDGTDDRCTCLGRRASSDRVVGAAEYVAYEVSVSSLT